MKKLYFLIACLFVSTSFFAQVDINFNATAFSADPTGTGLGYMNVFDNPKDGSIGGFQFGNGWGIADLVVNLDTGANTADLKPNRIGDTNVYWQTTGVLEGNKIMDASFYIENDALAGNVINFHANVLDYTLDDSALSFDFTHVAFIKVYASDYSSVLATQTYDLSTTGNFTITLDATSYVSGEHIQYGFEVIGPNINSDAAFDTDYANIGSILIGENTTLGVDENSISDFQVYPNPSNSVWNVKTNNTIINSIQVFDVLGKQVISLEPNLNQVAIDASQLPKGLYLARINSDAATNSIKLIKN